MEPYLLTKIPMIWYNLVVSQPTVVAGHNPAKDAKITTLTMMCVLLVITHHRFGLLPRFYFPIVDANIINLVELSLCNLFNRFSRREFLEQMLSKDDQVIDVHYTVT